jgi:hypothetical protein
MQLQVELDDSREILYNARVNPYKSCVDLKLQSEPAQFQGRAHTVKSGIIVLGINIVTLTLAFSTGPKSDHVKDIKMFKN